jgi:hypothetical protein
MQWHRARLEAVLEEEHAEIVADYRATCERARRFAEERLLLHGLKRRQVLTLLGLAVAGATHGGQALPGRAAPGTSEREAR